MGLTPNLRKNQESVNFMTCSHCGVEKPIIEFAQTTSPFFEHGHCTLCFDCAKSFLEQFDFSWTAVDKLCQWIDLPFVPREWERIFDMAGNDAFAAYARMFADARYDTLNWHQYYEEFKRLKEKGIIEDELPELREEKMRALREKWGPNYDDDALNYLETLYTGLLATQNVNGALQGDQALKICKISYELDERIRAGTDFEKILKAYDTLVKTAEFTPKNAKNINDFDSIGELFKWMERHGWHNPYYDGVSRDIVDETIQNIQNFNRRLYVNESGIGEEISRRLEALKNNVESDNYYGTEQNVDLDAYDSAGYEDLILNGDDEEFEAGDV